MRHYFDSNNNYRGWSVSTQELILYILFLVLFPVIIIFGVLFFPLIYLGCYFNQGKFWEKNKIGLTFALAFWVIALFVI